MATLFLQRLDQAVEPNVPVLHCQLIRSSIFQLLLELAGQHSIRPILL
jgi:hypothetical protein